MKTINYLFGFSFIILILYALITPVSADPLLFFNPGVVESNPGDEPTVDLIMEGGDEGISGFSLYLTIDNASVASFGAIYYPPWVSMNRITEVNSSTVLIQGADLGDRAKPGSPEERIASITLDALSAGYATLNVEPVIIDDDRKGRYNPISKSASIVISGAGPSPLIPAGN